MLWSHPPGAEVVAPAPHTVLFAFAVKMAAVGLPKRKSVPSVSMGITAGPHAWSPVLRSGQGSLCAANEAGSFPVW